MSEEKADLGEIHAVLDEILEEDSEFRIRSEACDYFRTLLIDADVPPERVEDFMKYLHSEPFRSSITDDEVTATPFEAMLAVDEGMAP